VLDAGRARVTGAPAPSSRMMNGTEIQNDQAEDSATS